MEAVVILIMNPNCAPADLVFQMSALELCVYSYCTRHSITPFACFVQRRSQRCLKACVHVLRAVHLCASVCHSECWRLAKASKQQISEAVFEQCLSLLPPSLLSSATPSREQREQRLALTEVCRKWGGGEWDAEDGRGKNKDLNYRGLKRPGKVTTEEGFNRFFLLLRVSGSPFVG